MKDNKGITLTSLIIYVIGMVIIISIISSISIFFYKNVNLKNQEGTTEYTKFSNVFSQEVNIENNMVMGTKTYNENGKKVCYIIFLSGNQYTYKEENKAIYKNDVKICDNIEDCEFSYLFIDSKYKITVDFKTVNLDMTESNAITYIM